MGRATWITLAGILVTSACEGGEPTRVHFATFNAGLAPADVDYADARVGPVVSALAADPADLLCVNEFWRAEDFEALTVAVAASMPNVIRREPMPVFTGCSAREFDPLRSCAGAQCPATCGPDLASCALAGCAGPLSALSSGCADCLLGAVTAGACVEQVWAQCEGPGGEGFLYEGSFDTGVLTRWPILAQASLVLDSYIVRASVDYALVDTEIGPVHVFCTHLASDISTFPYPPDYADYGTTYVQEHAHQVAQLLGFVREEAGADDRVVLLGDLNTGPVLDAAGIAGAWPDHYDSLIGAGFADPYAGQPDVRCSSCPTNTLVSPAASAQLIDHILLRGRVSSPRGARWLSEPVTLDVGGAEVVTNLSDHFGLTLSVAGSP